MCSCLYISVRLCGFVLTTAYLAKTKTIARNQYDCNSLVLVLEQFTNLPGQPNSWKCACGVKYQEWGHRRTWRACIGGVKVSRVVPDVSLLPSN